MTDTSKRSPSTASGVATTLPVVPPANMAHPPLSLSARLQGKTRRPELSPPVEDPGPDEPLRVMVVTYRGRRLERVVDMDAGGEGLIEQGVQALAARAHNLMHGIAEPANLARTRDRRDGPSIWIDHDRHQAWAAGTELMLTPMEFRLLSLLLLRPERAQSREQLLEDVWHTCPDVSTRTVDVHIRRLRQKLGELHTHIETVRGIGYRFRVTPKAQPGDAVGVATE